MNHNLPNVAGKYFFNFPMKDFSFLKVGGCCDIFYVPSHIEDLVLFLQNAPKNLPIVCLGNCSNVIISDSGIDGCVVNLSGSRNRTQFFAKEVVVDAGLGLSNFIKQCIEKGVSCCELLFSIPGTIGGAIAMNAGVPGTEISHFLKSISCVDKAGKIINIAKKDLNMQYRKGNLPSDFIVLSATFEISSKPKAELAAVIKNIQKKRLATQPITEATCGSTFKNPPGQKAWQLISESGCLGLCVGGAAVSDMHCNFLINKGNAKAADFVELIEIIKEKVFLSTGILLEEEVIKIGRP